MSKPVCLALAVLIVLICRSPAVADARLDESSRSPPFRLVLMATESPPTPPAGQTDANLAASAGLARALRGVAWGGVGLTLALVSVGMAFGVLAQQRADSLSQRTFQRMGRLPPIYDSEQQAEYTDLQNQGQTYNQAAVACFVSGGATALASAVLFWYAARNEMLDQQLALSASITPGGAIFAWTRRF